eukprot:1358902-Alexandrium_andersonii.AAC.1
MLWRGVMEALYGPNWRLDLLEAQEARELAVEEDQVLRDEGPQEERRLVIVPPAARGAAAGVEAEAGRGVRTPDAENACGLPPPEAFATPGTPGAVRGSVSGASSGAATPTGL